MIANSAYKTIVSNAVLFGSVLLSGTIVFLPGGFLCRDYEKIESLSYGWQYQRLFDGKSGGNISGGEKVWVTGTGRLHNHHSFFSG